MLTFLSYFKDISQATSFLMATEKLLDQFLNLAESEGAHDDLLDELIDFLKYYKEGKTVDLVKHLKNDKAS